MTSSRPAPTTKGLGPGYEVSVEYRDMFGPSSGRGVVRELIYPYAKGPVVWMNVPAGQTFVGRPIDPAWYSVPGEPIRSVLVTGGLPASPPPASDAGTAGLVGALAAGGLFAVALVRSGISRLGRRATPAG
jgi:hypothetical protein